MKSRWSRWSGAALPLLLIAGLAACGRSGAPESSNGGDVAPVVRRDLDVRVEAAGTVEPIRLVEVKSKASGEVLRILAETGDELTRGTLLVEIDPRDVRNALLQAEADLEVARARLATAEAQRQRAEELRKANVVTEQEYESAAMEEANARAQLVKAQTNLELARERMGDVTIRAPIDGTIIKREVEVGQIIASASQNISGGTTLLIMADLSEMQVRTLIDETDIGQIRPGQVARVQVQAYPGRTFVGSVLKIEPQAVVDQNVTMFPVLVRLDNRERLLKPGMNAEVEIEIARREDVVVVPNSAVVSPQDLMAAALAVGLDEDAVRTAMRSRRGGPGGPGGPGGAAPAAMEGVAARPVQGPGESAPPAEAGAKSADDAGLSEQCAALRERLQAGGMSALSDEDRAKLRECRQLFGGGPGAGGAGPQAGAAADLPFTPRMGFAFVKGPNGPEPRPVVLGMNDWDYTEVIRGVEPGEEVVIISVARLQQQQQQFAERVRQRAGGLFPGQQGGPAPGRR